MNPDTILRYCDEIDALTQAIRDELLAPAPPDGVVIEAGDDLQGALDAGGPIALAHAARFAAPGGYTCTHAQTTLTGGGDNTLTGETAPALRVPTGIDGIEVATLLVASQASAALQIGRNDAEQVTLDQAPVDIALRALLSTGHRGKRAVEVHGMGVEITDCEVHDCYATSGQDSQAIWIGNAPGPVRIEGGHFEAASENLMVGGDTMKIPDCRPTGITILHATFTKPLAWQAAGTPKVKNLLECKDGLDVLIEDCDLYHCWKSAQDGYAFMFTPANGGAVSVTVVNCRVREVGGIMNITGTDASGINTRRTQVTLRGGDYRTNKAAMGGSGRFCLATRGPEWILVEACQIAHEGSAFCDLADDKVPIDRLRIVNSTWNYGSYGIRIGGVNHGDNSAGVIGTVEITGNTISGAHSQFRARYPDNTYVAVMTAEREREVGDRAAAYAREVREDIKRLRQWEREYWL
jgi:uncharacterized protein YuzB (UPF0349 family)